MPSHYLAHGLGKLQPKIENPAGSELAKARSGLYRHSATDDNFSFLSLPNCSIKSVCECLATPASDLD